MEEKIGFPWVGISSQEGFDGGSMLDSPGVPRDGEKMMFPTIAAPQAPELVGAAPDQAKGSGGSREYSPREGKKGKKGINPGPPSF